MATPTSAKSGNALADGGFVEHHDGEIDFFGPYGCSSQWAAQSPVTHGKAFNFAVTDTAAGRVEYVRLRLLRLRQPASRPLRDGVAPWGSFHATGLPSRVAR